MFQQLLLLGEPGKLNLEKSEEDGDGMMGRPLRDSVWREDSVVLELELPSTLSEQYVPMPVSPLSDTTLRRRKQLPCSAVKGLHGHGDS